MAEGLHISEPSTGAHITEFDYDFDMDSVNMDLYYIHCEGFCVVVHYDTIIELGTLTQKNYVASCRTINDIIYDSANCFSNYELITVDSTLVNYSPSYQNDAKYYHGIVHWDTNLRKQTKSLPDAAWTLITDTVDFVLTFDREYFRFPYFFTYYSACYFEGDTISVFGYDTLYYDYQDTSIYQLEVLDVFGDTVTNIPERKTDMVTVFPNPCKDHLRIDSKSKIRQIKIYNLSGKLMLENELNGETQYTLSVSRLIRGAYFIRMVFKNGKTENHIFVKN